MTDLDVVGWFLGGQRSTRVDFSWGKYLLLFLNSPHRETSKNAKKIEGEAHCLGSMFLLKKNRNRLYFFGPAVSDTWSKQNLRCF
jgi:hypothetical protein